MTVESELTAANFNTAQGTGTLNLVASTPEATNRINHSPQELQVLREQALQRIRAGLRPGQQQIADWQSGPLAVSAVPGAGKSTGMAGAAVLAIARHQLHARRQLLIVTFTRSAAASIKAKLRENLRKAFLPQGSFVVHTLHGLAWQIANYHRELSGIALDTQLITPSKSHRLIRTCVERWIAANPHHYQLLLEGQQFDGEETERLRRQSVLRTEVLPAIAHIVIREARSSGLLSSTLWQLSEQTADDYRTLAIAAGLYEHYEKLLRLQRLIDYDDMILAALAVLRDEASRKFWQTQFFAVFEDEAQDSTPLQRDLLKILAADPNDANQPLNLVRVGDSNQAINSTFTPADPIYFRQFCDECEQQDRKVTMNQAGRSTQIIMESANFVLQWVNGSRLSGMEKPFAVQAIRPVAADDPQRNPTPVGRGLELYTPKDVNQSVEQIGQRVVDLFAEYPQSNAAVLVRTNDQGRFVAEKLRQQYGKALRIYEVGERDRRSQVPAEILALLQFVARPHSADYLKAALKVLVERQLIPTQDLDALASTPEQFLYPGPLDSPLEEAAQIARRLCTGLLHARMALPVYQLITFLAMALQYDQTDLATADKLADRISQMAGSSTMPNILAALNEIVSSESFEAVEVTENATADSPYTRSDQLTIITMHKAKGLDWDFVFIPFLHDHLIPGSLRVLPQAQFLGNFTLAEVARAQIRANLHQQVMPGMQSDQQAVLPDVAVAWERAGHLKTAEEFRLLYVAMTRAKRLLWMAAEQRAPFSWNKPDNLDDRRPCPVFPVLSHHFPTAVIKL